MPHIVGTNRLWPSLKSSSVLVLVLILAAALRIWAWDYGLPHPMARPDEEITGVRVVFPRYVLPLVPIMAVVAAEAAFSLISRTRGAFTVARACAYAFVSDSRQVLFKTSRIFAV